MSAINTTYYSQLFYPAAEFAMGALASIPASWALTVFHEHAHAFMANRLYDTKAVVIYGSLSSLGGLQAAARYTFSNPRPLTKWLGPSYSRALIHAAGPLAELIAMLAITTLTRLDRHAARAMLRSSVGLVLYSVSTPIGAVGKPQPVSFFVAHEGHDFYNLLVHGGKVAYGLLAVCTYSIAGLILGNAFGLNQQLLDKARNSTSDASRS
jgi:hypothetical protein